MRIAKTEKEEALLNAAVDHWGPESQINMAIEEMGELLSALNKYRRGRFTAMQVGEEIADVMLMLTQISKIFGGDFFIQANINGKLQRVESLLRDGGVYVD